MLLLRAPLVSQALQVFQELWDRKEKAGRLVWSDIRATKATAVIQDLWGWRGRREVMERLENRDQLEEKVPSWVRLCSCIAYLMFFVSIRMIMFLWFYGLFDRHFTRVYCKWYGRYHVIWWRESFRAGYLRNFSHLELQKFVLAKWKIDKPSKNSRMRLYRQQVV